MNNLGYAYANGEGVTKNLEEALKWYRMAAEKGNTSAMYNLGDAYLKGEGVTKNLEEAVKWYRMAADKGDDAAMYSLGYAYANGEGVTKNYQEAINWYRMAINKELSEKSEMPISSMMAMFGIGDLYYLRGLTRRGLPEDKKELKGEVVDFDKGDGLNSFMEAQKWFNKSMETSKRILEEVTDSSARFVAAMNEGNAKMYLRKVEEAIARGK